jgi:hypothetical protein
MYCGGSAGASHRAMIARSRRSGVANDLNVVSTSCEMCASEFPGAASQCHTGVCRTEKRERGSAAVRPLA